MAETRTCEHGRTLNTTQLPPGGWMGGVAFCDCCLSNYGYIDTGGMLMVDGEPKMRGVVNDKNKCKSCGGLARSWGYE